MRSLTRILLPAIMIAACVDSGAVRAVEADLFDLEVSLLLDRLPVVEPLGTIFQLSDDDIVYAGAGFVYANNTNQISNNSALTFFVRKKDRDVTISDLGQPFDRSVAFHLTTFQGNLYAIPYNTRGVGAKLFNKEGNFWESVNNIAPESESMIASFQPSGGSIIEFRSGPNRIKISNDYYDIDHIGRDDIVFNAFINKNRAFIYALKNTEIDRITTSHFYVCNILWSEKKLDECSISGDIGRFWFYTSIPQDDGIFVFGSRGEVFDVSNDGNVNVINGRSEISYQIYASLRYGSTFLLGQYPSGNLKSLMRGALLAPVIPEIGAQACSEPHGREAQSLSIWGGEVAVGMWPWGEVWTGRPGRDWTMAARVFQHPEQPCGAVPFAKLLEDEGEVYNALGQRIFGFANWANGLAVSTYLKHPSLSDHLDLLPGVAQEEYGRVLLLERDYEITCDINLESDMNFRFKIYKEKMSIYSNDEEVCSRPIDPDQLGDSLAQGNMQYGNGVWGKASGALLQISKR
ncbi:MAG: hypothetical protein MEP57_04340 [Microvirga sp.]|nr:hypothetical protein [Microvirga sp.]